jgi:hypothetical protein
MEVLAGNRNPVGCVETVVDRIIARTKILCATMDSVIEKFRREISRRSPPAHLKALGSVQWNTSDIR